MQKLEVINPYNLDQLEMINDFCLKQNVDNVAKILQGTTKDITEEKYKEIKKYYLRVEEYLMLKEDDKVIDYTYLIGEKDIKKCFLTLPNLLTKPKTRKIVNKALDYAFKSLNMEEVFITTTDISMIDQLEQIGFTILGNDHDNISFVIGKEEIKEETKNRGRR